MPQNRADQDQIPRLRRISSMSRMSSSTGARCLPEDLAGAALTGSAFRTGRAAVMAAVGSALDGSTLSGVAEPAADFFCAARSAAFCRAALRRCRPPVEMNSTAAAPATAMPAHFTGENTNAEAKFPIAVPIFQNISIDPVRYAAIGISDQAAPRSIARFPRGRPYL